MSSREAQQAITEVLVRYATGIDQRDWELFRACFTEDCQADYGVFGIFRGVAEITEWMRRCHANCGHTLHRISNVVVSERPGGAFARSYVDALVMRGDNHSGTRSAGFYDDELVTTEAGWKIERRRFTSVHVQTQLLSDTVG